MNCHSLSTPSQVQQKRATGVRALSSSSSRSVDPFAGARRVDLFEGRGGALVEDSFWAEALVLVVTVGCHARLEALEVLRAELGEDILSGRVFVLSGEEDDSIIDERRLFFGTTEHVDHIFHGHGD